MDLQEFKIRMLAKIKREKKADEGNDLKTRFKKFLEKQQNLAVQPSYAHGLFESESISFNNIVISLALGVKSRKLLYCDLFNRNCKSEEEYFELFKNYFYDGDFEKANLALSKCAVFNQSAYIKWQMLLNYSSGTLSLESLKKVQTGHWEIESKILESYFTNSESAVQKLFSQNEYYGSILWTRLFSVSSHPDKGKIIISILRRLVEKYPNYTEAYIILIKVLYQFKIKHGQGLCNSAILRFGQIPDEFMVFINIKYSQFLVLEEKYRLALEHLQETFKRFPHFIRILYYYGKICMKWNNHNAVGSGIGALKQVGKVQGVSPKIMYWMIEGYVAMKQVYQVVKYINRIEAEKLSPKKQKKLDILASQYSEELSFAKAFNNKENPSLDVLTEASVFRLYYESLQMESTGEEYKAVKLLRTCQLQLDYDLSYSLKELKLLVEISDADYPIKCNELVEKLTNTKIVPNQWIKALLVYSKFLLKGRYLEESIKVLKCIGKIFPKYPYSLPYVESILTAETLNSAVHELRFSRGPMEKEINQREIAETTISEIVDAIQSVRSRRYTHQISKIKITSNIPSIKDTSFLNESQTSRVEYKTTLTSWMFSSSDPTFLYKIGKYSAISRFKTYEGILAVKDFMEIVDKYNPALNSFKKHVFRGKFYLMALYKQSKQEALSTEIHNEISKTAEFSSFSLKNNNLLS